MNTEVCGSRRPRLVVYVLLIIIYYFYEAPREVEQNIHNKTGYKALFQRRWTNRNHETTPKSHWPLSSFAVSSIYWSFSSSLASSWETEFFSREEWMSSVNENQMTRKRIVSQTKWNQMSLSVYLSESGMQSHLELDEKNTTKTTVMTHESSSSTLSWVPGLSLSSFSCIITFSLSVCLSVVFSLFVVHPLEVRWEALRQTLLNIWQQTKQNKNQHSHQELGLHSMNRESAGETDWFRHGCCSSRSSPGGYCIWPRTHFLSSRVTTTELNMQLKKWYERTQDGRKESDITMTRTTSKKACSM